MYTILIIEFLHWLFFLPLLLVPLLSLCSSNDRDREQMHLERRQALRDRQREAAISGRSVRSVIETEVESESNQYSRLSCVRMAPKLKTHSGVNTAEVYERLNQNDSLIQKLDKEKPPSVEIVTPAQPRPMEKSEGGSKEADFVDERDKVSAEATTKLSGEGATKSSAEGTEKSSAEGASQPSTEKSNSAPTS